MAGHSKWNNIKHKKSAEDKKRAKVFSKLSKKIRVAVKQGGSGDPEQNSSLRPLLDKAKEANMPKDNIQRAIDAGLGQGDNGPLEEMIYEGFGPQGTGLLIQAATDNKNRTSSELRYILNSHDGSLGAPGSVQYMFARDKQGQYRCTVPLQVSDQAKKTLETLCSALLEQEDVEQVYCTADIKIGTDET